MLGDHKGMIFCRPQALMRDVICVALFTLHVTCIQWVYDDIFMAPGDEMFLTRKCNILKKYQEALRKVCYTIYEHPK